MDTLCCGVKNVVAIVRRVGRDFIDQRRGLLFGLEKTVPRSWIRTYIYIYIYIYMK